MNKNLKSLTLTALVLLASCSKDESSDAENKDQAIEKLEQTPLNIDTVSDNVIIAGGKKETGTLPTPNKAITLDVSKASTTALLGEGFEVPLSSDGTITGAYIQFKANDGTVSDTYYDIDLNANASNKATEKKGKASLRSAKEDSETTLDVDFNTKIEPGTFCYVICVYDADGNISAPEEICVTVESWGGNSAISGTWNIKKYVDTYDGETKTEVIGEKNCDDYSRYCSVDETYKSITECETLDSAILILNADGTYSTESKGIDEFLDEDIFVDTCDISYKEYDYGYESEGNWAYVAETKRLTIVEYKYTETYRGETETETLNAGEGELMFDGIIDLDGKSLIINEDFGQGETYVVYFEKE
ncbi:hypothetical protein [Flagellimonas pacifica]|uniref:Lipocalin-like domain-containing protein n=1 Tax=Flagellimonas pacifica TaxID=1247520 RepID=A0A285MDH6_9FLAO|nr:hypothetical protein [Allomuricauda parva]SNY95220.1 hypothetical protein SAMN06265377_0886 [Allomuricauda parva]